VAERDYQLWMLHMRSYGSTEEKTFLEAGRKSLEETKRTLKALDDHAEKMSNRDLEEKADNGQTKVGEYEALGNETVSRKLRRGAPRKPIS
jgi:hypothetical protein